MPYQLRDLEDAVVLPTGQFRTAQADVLTSTPTMTTPTTLYADGVDMSDQVDEQQPTDPACPDAVSWLEGYLVQIWRQGADGNWCR